MVPSWCRWMSWCVDWCAESICNMYVESCKSQRGLQSCAAKAFGDRSEQPLYTNAEPTVDADWWTCSEYEYSRLSANIPWWRKGTRRYKWYLHVLACRYHAAVKTRRTFVLVLSDSTLDTFELWFSHVVRARTLSHTRSHTHAHSHTPILSLSHTLLHFDLIFIVISTWRPVKKLSLSLARCALSLSALH